jgi:Holliday junction resolvase-like predicted endonuclease
MALPVWRDRPDCSRWRRAVFVEVRTRRGSYPPAESIDLTKQHKLAQLAYTYLQNMVATEQPWRIDVIAVTIGHNGRILQLEHIRHAIEG